MATTVRVSEATRDRLRAVSSARGRTADEVINEALDEWEKRQFWDQYAEAAEADVLSEDERAERADWDRTRSDGRGR